VTLNSPRSTRRVGRRRHFSTAFTFTSASSPSISSSIRGSDTESWPGRRGVAIEALTVEISRMPKPSWTVGPMRSTSAADRSARGARSGKLSAAERSALKQALAKALAFRDAGKMLEAREWANELVRLLKSHDLLT
jgi:hypothetical protein